MATHDYNLANQSGASFRSDLNNALQAVLTNNSSASSPSTTAAYMFWADTNTGILKIRNSANDAWVELLQLDGTLTLEDGSASAVALGFRDELNTGIFSSGASNFDVAIAGTTRLNISATGLNVTGTVTDDGSTHDGDVTFTGASANIVFDKSDNALEFADNAKATFGADADLTISHDGSNSIINDAGTGELQLQRAGNTILALDSEGVSITDPDGKANLKIIGFEGNPAELNLVADEGDDNGDTWVLQSHATSNNLNFRNDTSGSSVVKWNLTTDGDVTQTGHLSLPDSKEIRLGGSDDLKLYHDGSNSFIQDAGTGTLHLDTNGTKVQIFADGTSSKTMANFNKEDSVQLYYDGNERLATTASGISVFRNVAGSDALLNVENQNSDSASDAILRLRVAGTSQHSKVEFGDSGDANNGMIDYDHNAVDMTFHVNGSAHYEMDAGAFHPTTDDADDLGRSTNRFDDVRATNGTIATSDRNEKNTIVASDLGLDFVNKLTPVSYKFNNKTRTHYGLIAQDIETLLGTLGKSGTDFAGFCKDQITIKTEIDEDGNGQEITLETPFDRYGLRYNEFIAPMIKAIQELSAKVTALEGS